MGTPALRPITCNIDGDIYIKQETEKDPTSKKPQDARGAAGEAEERSSTLKLNSTTS